MNSQIRINTIVYKYTNMCVGGRLLGKWEVDCEVYSALSGIVGLSDTQTQSTNPGGATSPHQTIYVLHNTNYSLSTFAILEDNTVLIADSSFDHFMTHLKPFYKKGKFQFNYPNRDYYKSFPLNERNRPQHFTHTHVSPISVSN